MKKKWIWDTGRKCWIENNICHIPLANGEIALCDEDRFDEVSKKNWSISSGYPATTHNGKVIRLHKFLYLTDKTIDHINNNKLDNRSCNLRICSLNENLFNQPKYKKNKSGYKGVCLDKKTSKWFAQLQFKGKQINIGRFGKIIDAARAYDKKAKELFGEFANLNFKGE